jgi:hypothetical protein
MDDAVDAGGGEGASAGGGWNQLEPDQSQREPPSPADAAIRGEEYGQAVGTAPFLWHQDPKTGAILPGEGTFEEGLYQTEGVHDRGSMIPYAVGDITGRGHYAWPSLISEPAEALNREAEAIRTGRYPGGDEQLQEDAATVAQTIAGGSAVRGSTAAVRAAEESASRRVLDNIAARRPAAAPAERVPAAAASTPASQEPPPTARPVSTAIDADATQPSPITPEKTSGVADEAPLKQSIDAADEKVVEHQEALAEKAPPELREATANAIVNPVIALTRKVHRDVAANSAILHQKKVASETTLQKLHEMAIDHAKRSGYAP